MFHTLLAYIVHTYTLFPLEFYVAKISQYLREHKYDKILYLYNKYAKNNES